MSIKAILFDLDNVLIDTGNIHYTALNLALQDANYATIDPKQHHELYDGLPTAVKLQMLVDRGLVRPESVPAILCDKKSYTNRLLKGYVKFDPEIYCLLVGLHEYGLKLGVVSNAIRETVLSVCRTLQISESRVILVTNEDGRPKPAPDLYTLACSKLGLPPSECLAVEDGKYGIEAARKAGCKVLEVKNRSEVTATNIWSHLC